MKNLLTFLLVIPQLLLSQQWTEDLQDPNKNFYEIQQEFNEYWKNKSYEKGKGWKQFKRWENFIEQRVFPDGVMRHDILFEEYQRLKENSTIISNNVWTQVGPDNVPLVSGGSKRGIGRVNTIAFHPTDPNKIYVGAPAGGFWKSDNGGQTWSTTTDFLSNLGVSDIALNPNNPNEIFIITGDRDAGDTYSYGLMKSVDGGNSFNTTGLSFNITSYYRGNRVLIDPTNTNVIIVSTSNGIYRSTDGGSTFTNTFSSANMTDIEFHTTNTNIVYGASKGNTSIYKSTDNGISWSQSGSGLPSTSSVVRACVAVTPDNPSAVYALFGDNNNGYYGVYKSMNEGQTWVQQSNSPNLLGWSTTGSDSDGQAWYDLAFACDPNDEETLFVGGVNTWKSTDGGQNWTLNTHWTGSGGADYMHADEHMLKYNPLNDYIYSGNDGGLYVSTDNGGNWTDISDGLQITQFYSLGVSQTVQDLVITGSQDNGTFLKDGSNWDAVIGGDGMECIIDYTNSNIMYGELYYGSIRKSTNGGNSFSTISSGNGAWETPYILDRNDPNTIYVGYDELEKSTDGGNNWNTITNNQTNGGKIDEIAVSKSSPSVIYFSDGPNLYKTSDGGSNWSNISNGLPYKTIKYIAIHPNDPGKVWVVFSGYTSGEKVYKTLDGGSNWQNYSGTLPNIPVNTIVLDENSATETLYIGTDLGVFIRDNTATDWSNFNNLSLPNVIVSELEIQYQANKLIAATYGRGLWIIDLQITSPPSANFFASDSVFCNIPTTVDFTNTSFYSNSYYWDFGDGNTSTSTNPTHTYTSFGTYTVSLIATGPLGVDSIVAQSLVDIDANNPCIITMPVSGSGVTQTACNGTLYDVGGPNGNYFDNNDSWVSISPIGASQVTIDFLMFDLETSTNCIYDYVEIFDGNSTAAPSLGQFCNNSPGTITSSGGDITIFLHADPAVNGQGFEMSWTCTYPTAPPVTSFEASDTMSCSGTINFTDLSSNGPTSWLWNFGDGTTSNQQNPTHVYQNGGMYTVSLTTTNQYGTNSYSITDYINIMNLNLSLVPDSSCGSSSLVLQSNSSNIINWYSDASAQNLVGTGASYTTPVLSSSTTYYAQAEMNFANIFGGPVDNSFGSGSTFQGDRHLVFDNFTPSKLVSVMVYAYSAGNRTIELRNSSNAVLMDTTVFIPSSIPNGYRVYLDFDLPVQNNMQLGLNGSNNDMFRNSDGAVFPYDISNIISITGTNASAGYYYFFYDWEIKKEPCTTNLIPVEAIIHQQYSTIQNIDLCNGGSVSVGNNTYSSTGIYSDLFTTSNGCDSIIITNLTVGTNSTTTNNVNICHGESYSIGSNIYTQTGQYIDTISNGACDSIINTNLTVYSLLTNQMNYTICFGDSVLISGEYYNSPVMLQDTFLSASGCDSIITYQLSVVQSSLQTNPQSICSGESYNINNNIYSQPGSYTDILTNALGCDSIVNTILTVYPTDHVSNNLDICLGDSVIVGNNIYNIDGIYTDVLTNSYMCDSVVTTYLSVSDLSSNLSLNGTNIDASALNGVSPFTYDIYGPNGLLSSSTSSGGVLQFTPLLNGVYYFIVTDAIGCVSDTSFMFVDFAATSIYNQINFIELDKIVDVLGREVPFRKNTLLVFIYKDGTIERKILFE